ncbi:MAG TPA: serine hydrolase domain-containing protein, partial [Pyrinomonadaceae bacterium]|nr:serine hydrolase domain-containing protein [Pyrinomonadaceae bacterium]
MNPAKLAQIDALVAQDIKDKKLPGAVVLVGHKGKIVFRKAYGNRSLVPTVEPMTLDTIFDLASLTKVVATTTSIMILVEQGKLRLSETIGKYIPEIQDEQVKRVTIQQLMTHTSGFAPDFDLKEKWTGREGMLQALYKEKLRTPPGLRFVYSDINYITLAEILQRVSKQELWSFANRYVFEPTAMSTTRFFDAGYQMDSARSAVLTPIAIDSLPTFQRLKSRIAPTENVRGQ